MYATVAAKLARTASGRVSVEVLSDYVFLEPLSFENPKVDPRLFDDANKIVQEVGHKKHYLDYSAMNLTLKVRELAKVLNGYGTDVKDKILFKIPGTWEVVSVWVVI